MQPIFRMFQQAIKFDFLALTIFKDFLRICDLYFRQISTSVLYKSFKRCFKLFFGPFQCAKHFQ